MSKILIVEKNEDELLHKIAALNNKGFQVHAVMDTDKLYAKIYSYRPDIIVIAKDCSFIEAELKAFEPTRHICMIALKEDSFDCELIPA